MLKIQRIIIHSKPVQFVVNWTKRISLPGFHKIPLYDVLAFFGKQLTTTNIGQRAAAVSYNLIIAIPAGFIFLFTIVPHLPQGIRNDFNNELFKLITAYFTPTPSTEIWLKESINDFINKQRGTLSIVGLFLVVWATSNAMIGIMGSFDNTIVVFKKKKNFLQQRFTAIKLTSLLVFIVIACVALLISEGKLLKYIFQRVDFEDTTTRIIVKTLDWFVIILITIISIGAIYRYAPAVHKRWSLITPGSLLTTFLLLLTTFIFSYWVSNFSNYNKLYGSIGTVIILMVLIYFNSIVLLIGFELNNSIRSLREQAKEQSA
jgi:membrane protein